MLVRPPGPIRVEHGEKALSTGSWLPESKNTRSLWAVRSLRPTLSQQRREEGESAGHNHDRQSPDRPGQTSVRRRFQMSVPTPAKEAAKLGAKKIRQMNGTRFLFLRSFKYSAQL